MSVRAFGPPFRAAFGRILGGLGASFGLLLLELLVVALFRHRELASIWELEFGALFLMPVAWLLSVPLGLFGILGFVLLQRAERRPERLLLAGGLGAFACLVGFFVGGGRHLSALPVRAGFALLVGLAVALPAHALAVRVARELRARPLRGAAAIAFSVVLIELVNRWVLPRLYPAFHWGLAALALMLAPSVVLTVHPLGSGAPRRPVWLVLGPCLLGVLGLSFVPASHRLSHFDNFRLLLLEDAPLLGRAVEIAARVAPPPALGESCEGAACAPDRSRAGSGRPSAAC